MQFKHSHTNNCSSRYIHQHSTRTECKCSENSNKIETDECNQMNMPKKPKGDRNERKTEIEGA